MAGRRLMPHDDKNNFDHVR